MREEAEQPLTGRVSLPAPPFCDVCVRCSFRTECVPAVVLVVVVVFVFVVFLVLF